MHIMPSFGGRALFNSKCHTQCSCFFPRTIRAVLLLRNALFRTFVCFRRTVLIFFGMIISAVGCRQSSCSYSVESSFTK
jgi:hypothetical protein